MSEEAPSSPVHQATDPSTPVDETSSAEKSKGEQNLELPPHLKHKITFS
jgi:hypothetical protein